MNPASLYRRVVRRELHSPRSFLAITVAVVVILLCLYIGTEIVLMMLGQAALLASPQGMLAALGAGQPTSGGVAIGVGIALVTLGLLLLIAALTPGRRARHRIAASRAAVVVDAEVIASALARHAAHAGNTHPDNALVTVSTRRAIVRLTPTSGIPAARDAVSEAVQEQLNAYDITPTIRATIDVASRGKVGT